MTNNQNNTNRLDPFDDQREYWNGFRRRLREAIAKFPDCDLSVCKELHALEAQGIHVPETVDTLWLALTDLVAIPQ